MFIYITTSPEMFNTARSGGIQNIVCEQPFMFKASTPLVASGECWLTHCPGCKTLNVVTKYVHNEKEVEKARYMQKFYPSRVNNVAPKFSYRALTLREFVSQIPHITNPFVREKVVKELLSRGVRLKYVPSPAPAEEE